MAEIRQRIVFHGRVQGVGFRYTAKYLAQSLGLTGWVENEFDGTVVMEIQGREPSFFQREWQEWLHRRAKTSPEHGWSVKALRSSTCVQRRKKCR